MVSQSLSLTESNVSTSANTSKVRILWTSTQSGDSWNGYTKVAKYYISINNGAKTEYKVSYTLPKGKTVTILDTTITVTHNGDGSGSVEVSTWMDTGISAGVIEQTKKIDLTTIQRASTLDSLVCATNYFDGKMTYKYTPKVSSYYNRCNISLKNNDETYILIKSIYLGKKTASQQTATVTFTAEELDKIYKYFTATTIKGTLRFTFRTYSDSEYKNLIGEPAFKDITLSIPENSTTKPSIEITSTTPVSTLPEAFKDVYIQGRSKVQVVFEADGKYNATITSNVNVGGKDYGTRNTSDWLKTPGEITVAVAVTDSRKFTNKASKKITVIPYSKPRILPCSSEKEIICKRCDADGNYSESGTYLRVKARKSCESVNNLNKCGIYFRCKTDSQSWNEVEWATIHAETDSGNEVDTFDLSKLGIQALSPKTSYVAEIRVTDSVGEYSYTTITIPTELVYTHEDGARRSFAFGKYVEDDNTFDIAEDIDFKVRTKGGVTTVIKDTGWVNLALSSAVSETTGNVGHYKGCAYRVINGNHVYVAFNCTVPFAGSTVVINEELLPEAYRPPFTAVYGLFPLAGRRVMRAYVYKDGRIACEWIQDLDKGTTTEAYTANWCDVYIDYFI